MELKLCYGNLPPSSFECLTQTSFVTTNVSYYTSQFLGILVSFFVYSCGLLLLYHVGFRRDSFHLRLLPSLYPSLLITRKKKKEIMDVCAVCEMGLSFDVYERGKMLFE